MDSKDRVILLGCLVGLSAGLRLYFADWPNVAPIGAMALFAGASFSDKRIAIALTLAVMLITDAFLGFHSTIPFVYVGLLGYLILGAVAGNDLRVTKLLPATLAGSLFFFVITNLGAFFAFYPRSWASLVECYTLALPFFKHTLVGDLMFGCFYFGVLSLAQKNWPSLKPTLNSPPTS